MPRFLLLLLVVGCVLASPAVAQPVTLEAPGLVLRGVPFDVAVSTDDPTGIVTFQLTVSGREVPLAIEEDGTWRA